MNAKSPKSFTKFNANFSLFSIVTLVAFFSVGLLACGSNSSSINPSNQKIKNAPQNLANLPSQQFSQKSILIWNSYVNSLPLGKIQTECFPRRFPHQGNFKGTVVLFHGFSACPQQFWELGKQLSDNGFEVLLPLLPGHGRKRVGQNNSEENLEQLPNFFTWNDYNSFSQIAANIVRESPNGTNTIGGLSGGASVATNAILNESYSGLWQRALLMAPMYNTLDSWKRVFPEVVGNIPFVNELFGRSWGPQCLEDSATPFGPGNFVRGGFCSFKVNHAAAIDSLGQQAIAKMQHYQWNQLKTLQKTNIQFVYTDFDSNTRPRSLNLAAEALSSGNLQSVPTKPDFRPFQTQSCSFDASVPHSFISRYDTEAHADPARKKYWLKSLIRNSVAFVNSGITFPTKLGKSAYDKIAPCEYSVEDSSNDVWPVPN